MKLPRPLHPWRVSPTRAVEIQHALARRVHETRPRRAFRLVAGLDTARFQPESDHCVAGVVVWDLATRRVLEERVCILAVRFPYVPGLLSFREAPALLAVLRRLRQVPDVLLCDGHGRAHPRRFGLACHLGLLTGLPSVGCAKGLLVGEHPNLGWRRGSRAGLRDRGVQSDEIIGSVVRTRDGVRPVYVSVGHRIDLASAEALVLDCCEGFRIPEPTRRADHLVSMAASGGKLAILGVGT